MDFDSLFDGITSGRTIYNQGLITGIFKALNRKLILTSDGSVEQILTSRECREIIADAVEITKEKCGN